MTSARSPRLIYRIWTPEWNISGVGLFIIAVGYIVSWVVTYAVTFFALLPIVGLSDDPPTWCYVTSILTGIGGAVVGGWLLGQWRFLNYWPPRSYRAKRLKRISAYRPFATRLLHREFESSCYQGQRGKNHTKQLVRKFKSGTMLIMNGLKQAQAFRPEPVRVQFEPLPLDSDSELLGQLTTFAIEETGITVDELLSRQPPQGKLATIKSKAGWLWRVGSPLFFVTYVLVSAIRGEIGFMLFVGGIMIIFALAATKIISLREWFMVPGGIVSRKLGFLGRTATIRLFTPASTPLLIDFRKHTGYVRDGRKIHKFEFTDSVGWLLPAAWFAEVPAPSEREIIALLDPEQAERESTKSTG